VYRNIAHGKGATKGGVWARKMGRKRRVYKAKQIDQSKFGRKEETRRGGEGGAVTGNWPGCCFPIAGRGEKGERGFRTAIRG